MSMAIVPTSPTGRIRSTVDDRTTRYLELKGRVHQELLNRLNLDRLTQVSRVDAEPEIRSVVGMILDRESAAMPLSLFERETVSSDVLDELFGLGPLELLLKDPAISDILVNRADQIYIEREGRIEETDIVFRDDKHLMQIIERIVSAVGRRIDESSPMVDARLQDGSRVNVIIPPLALDGPVMSIRRFRTDRLGAADLVERESLTAPMLDFLKGAIGARLNVIVSGGTGAGKTTMLNVLSSYVSESERVVTIEDAAELTLRQRHVVRLETRPPNIEGKGGIKQRQLVINALRMRPDRIIVGEVRGEEALDMLQAMNTGHDGSLTTIHANSPRDALYRLDTMIAMANLNIPDKAVRQQVASAVNIVIQVTRLTDGSRRVTSISEITGMEQDVIAMQEIFQFHQSGINEAGKVVGVFRATGVRPKCADRITASGRPLPMDMFSHAHPVNQIQARHERRF
jgi:pilus assembly protein CpaF